MELRSTREMRRNEQIARAMGRKTDAAPAKAQAQSGQPQAPADKVSLSRQALAWAEEQNRKMWDAAQEREQKRQSRMDAGLSALETSKNQLDSMEKKLKVLNKCQKIAASIMKGDRVPPEDLRYLMNNDPEGYKLAMAMAMRRPKEDPEDCKSVLDEEDKNGGGEESGGGEAVPVSTAEASSAVGGASAAAE